MRDDELPEVLAVSDAWEPETSPHRDLSLPFFSAASLAGKPVPMRHWHVEQFIPGRNVTLLAGDGATGKTLVALQLAVATATTTSWLGKLPAGGRAMFVTAEDDTDELHRRLADIAMGQGVPLETMTRLHLLSLAGMDAILSAPQGRSDLMQATELYRKLEAEVMQFRPVLLVIDPLADVFGGDEIKKSHARQFISLLRGLALKADLAVLLLSHPSQAGMSSGQGTSGNVGWSNSVRSRLYFERPPADGDDPVDEDARILTVKKSNYGPAGPTIKMLWHEGIFVLENPVSASGNPAADADHVFLDLLAQFERAGRHVSDKHSSTYAPSVFANHVGARGIRKAAFKQAMDRLFEANRIKIVIEGPPSRQRSRLAIVGL